MKKVGIGDRTNMLFSSSLITYGRGKGIVVETGMNTEVGKIATIINDTVGTATPLQIKTKQIGKNTWYSRTSNLCCNIYYRYCIWKRCNRYVYDSSKLGSCSNSRRLGSSFDNSTSNRCTGEWLRKMLL